MGARKRRMKLWNQQVQTHASLLATLSKKRGELFTTCITTFPTMVVFIPDMKKEVVEMMLSLYSNKWEEVEVDHSLRQSVKLLAQFFSGFTSRGLGV